MSKATFINTTHIEGYLYQHSLELKTTGPNSKAPGTQYITGSVEIATNEDCTNIVPVHFSYVTAVTSKGKSNATYGTLQNIIEGRFKSVLGSSKDEAVKLRIDSAIGLNEFYSDSNGDWELVSVKRNEGGFIHTTEILSANENDRNRFKVDMLITGCVRHEADEERNIPERMSVRGAIFDFKKSLLPVEFTALNEGAMNYFEGLGATNKEPVFTSVWGNQIATTITRQITEESAFGENYVREVNSTRKDFVITGAAAETYAWDDESTITAADLTKFMGERETYLATLKQRAIEYKEQRNQPASAIPNMAASINAASTNTIANGGYNF